MSARKYVIQHLKENPDQKFTRNQLVEILIEKHPDWHQNRLKHYKNNLQKTKDNIWGAIGASLHRDGIRWTQEPPYNTNHYYFAGKDAPSCMHLTQIPPKKPSQPPREQSNRETAPEPQGDEHALYEPLRLYLKECNVHAMRINEKRSSNKGGSNRNRWRFPDLVGLEPVSQHWKAEISHFAKEMSAPKARLWSLEVKKSLTPANAREAYFQAISNSSWAHVAFLVTESLHPEAFEEIRLLNEAHGVGLIQLTPRAPEEALFRGTIRVNARPRHELDWHSIDKLFRVNSDFSRFIKKVQAFMANNTVPEFPAFKRDAS